MNRCCGEKLAVLGTAIAMQIARGISASDTNILGALFNVIGDQLSLIAATEVDDESSTKDSESSRNNDKSSNKE